MKFLDGGKRASHNAKERQRRGDLKNNLESLRQVVPSVANNPKASMVNVLLEATKQAYACQAQEHRFESLRKRHTELLKKKRKLLQLLREKDTV